MFAVIRFVLLTLLLCTGITSNVFAGHNSHVSADIRFANNINPYRYTGHGYRERYIEHHYRYIEHQPHYVIEEYERPRYYHDHDQHCAHHVINTQRVVYQESYFNDDDEDDD